MNICKKKPCVCTVPMCLSHSFFQSPKKVLEYQVILKTQMKLSLNIAMWIFQVNLDLILYLHRLCAFLVNALSQPFLEPSFQDKSLGFPNPGSKSIDCSSKAVASLRKPPERKMKLHINATKMLQSKYKNAKFRMKIIKTYLKSVNCSVGLVYVWCKLTLKLTLHSVSLV